MDDSRENRYPSSSSTFMSHAAVAQWIEYWPPKPRVAGSIPASRTIFVCPLVSVFLLLADCCQVQQRPFRAPLLPQSVIRYLQAEAHSLESAARGGLHCYLQ